MKLEVRINDVLLIYVPTFLFYGVFHMFFVFLCSSLPLYSGEFLKFMGSLLFTSFFQC
jgi:hypothetical protein